MGKVDAAAMKAFAVATIVAAACMLGSAQAQVKGARSYFPKNYPAPPPGGAQGGQGAQSPGTNAPARVQLPKFKDLPVNGQFYFLSDTNKTFAWTKISATQAKNTKNGITQTINGEIPIQR